MAKNLKKVADMMRGGRADRNASATKTAIGLESDAPLPMVRAKISSKPSDDSTAASPFKDDGRHMHYTLYKYV